MQLGGVGRDLPGEWQVRAEEVRWLSPDEPQQEGAGKAGPVKVMPLYPLPSVYTPFSNPSLNNIESRNKKMVDDVIGGDGRFCVSMMAQDTGRLAEVGLVFRLETREIVSLSPSNPSAFDVGRPMVKYLLNNTVVGRVRIQRVLNPEAWSAPGRPDYLLAEVSPLLEDAEQAKASDTEELEQEAAELFNEIAGSLEAPPPGEVRLEERLGASNFSSCEQAGLWSAAALWQSYCHTRLAYKHAVVSTDLNELVVDAAFEQGGPVNLPVRPETLSSELQERLQRETQKLAARFREEVDSSGCDPYMPFQVLNQATSHCERLRILKGMLLRERSRLRGT